MASISRTNEDTKILNTDLNQPSSNKISESDKLPDPSIAATVPGQLRVIKREGGVVEFDPDKIFLAIMRAFLAVKGHAAGGSTSIRARVSNVTDAVVRRFQERLPSGGTVSIEEIQDLVELALMREEEQQVARAYVLYREERAKARAERVKRNPQLAESVIRVTRSDGTIEPLDSQRIHSLIQEACTELEDVDHERVAKDAMSTMYDGITTRNINAALITAARALIEEEPNYTYVAARLLLEQLRQESLSLLGIRTLENDGRRITQKQMPSVYASAFSPFIHHCIELELLAPELASFDLECLGAALQPNRDLKFTYLGLQTLYDRYFLHSNDVRIELPQFFFMRVAMGLALHEDDREKRAIEFYNVLSKFDFMSSTPTLFNSGTLRPQLSSCYLTTVLDDLDSIYGAIRDNALLSKWAGGLGNDWTQVRALGSYIKGTNGKSQGIVPFLKVVNDTAIAVNQCFDPDTLIYTTDGVKSIDNISTKDLVLGKDGEYRQVLDVLSYTQNGPMTEMNIEHSVQPLRVTSGHPLKAIRRSSLGSTFSQSTRWLRKGKIKAEWIEAGKIKNGDYIARTIPAEIVPVEDFDENDARFYGILLSDGEYSNTKEEWSVYGNPNNKRTKSYLEFVEKYLALHGIDYWVTMEGRRNYKRIRWTESVEVKQEATTGSLYYTGVRQCPRFTQEDLYNSKREKRIAHRFSHLPEKQTLALIYGLLETDGTIGQSKQITFTSTSASLAEDVRYQLLRIKIPTSIDKRIPKGSRIGLSSKRMEYVIHIPAVPLLANKLGTPVCTKQTWLEGEKCIYSRVQSVNRINSTQKVVDLKVEGISSYNTTNCLAHNGGKRKGAVCSYLETWHLDIEEFLELRKNTGDDRRRTHDMNTASWIPDLFMKRVSENEDWTLFSPNDVPDLHDLYGRAFEKRYIEYEEQTRAGKLTLFKRVKAAELWRKMLSMLFETGHPWITFKDACNIRSPQQHVGVVHSSNLCTEITLNTSKDEIAVCNLGSINLVQHLDADGELDHKKLKKTVRTAIRMLDNVIDINYYAVPTARASNIRHRPVGLGVMGFQDALYVKRIPYGTVEAVEFADESMEAVSYYAIETSSRLAKERGSYSTFEGSLWSQGILPIDSLKRLQIERGEKYLDVNWTSHLDWDQLRLKVMENGMRNSNTLAIAPTATIANITGVTQSIEPSYQNLYVKSNLSGEFTVVNPFLVRDLKKLRLWDAPMISDLKYYNGSVRPIDRIPAEYKKLYATAFEVEPRWLVDSAARRQKWIDQSQSLNLYMAEAKGRKLDVMYRMAWQRGLKTTYYLRAMSATNTEKSTVDRDRSLNAVNPVQPALVEQGGITKTTRQKMIDIPDPIAESPVACSIDDPDCESCQ